MQTKLALSPTIRSATLLLFCLFSLSGCKRNSGDSAELSREIERLENVVANQRLLLEDRGSLSWESLERSDPITRRHLMISIWYADQAIGSYYIGREMDHDWGPRWNRRSPLSILEEEVGVMRKFLETTRNLEELSSRSPTYPTEKDSDPNDGARIDWENYFEAEGTRGNPPIWFGRNAKSGKWMVFQHGGGVSEPSAVQLKEIERIKTEELESDPFGGLE